MKKNTKEETSLSTLQTRKEYSKAENSFRKFILEKYPKYTIYKRGMPDFMIWSGDKFIGFVEVKRVDLNDTLRKEQEIFRKFCKQYKIPYQIWSPRMDIFKSKEFKKVCMQKTTNWNL